MRNEEEKNAIRVAAEGNWIKMRPSRARSSAQAASCHILSSVDFITSTFESEFLVYTGLF